MKRVAFLLPATILAAALAFAQDKPNDSNVQSSTPSQSTTATPNDQTGNTMRGCLGGSTGSYTFTDGHTGTVYNLTGSTDNLSSKVGHEVEITGQPASSASTSNSTSNNSNTNSTSDPNASNANGSSSSTSNMLQVSNVTDVADHCSGTGTGPSAANNVGGTTGNSVR
jgi:hypothetical protein